MSAVTKFLGLAPKKVFKSPKLPPLPEPVKAPTAETATAVVEQKAQIEEDKMKSRRGRASTILSNAQSRTQIAGGGLKTVLGL